MTVAELTTAIPHLRKHDLHNWAKRGRLDEHTIQVFKGGRIAPVTAFRLADVLDLATERKMAS